MNTSIKSHNNIILVKPFSILALRSYIMWLQMHLIDINRYYVQIYNINLQYATLKHIYLYTFEIPLNTTNTSRTCLPSLLPSWLPPVHPRARKTCSRLNPESAWAASGAPLHPRSQRKTGHPSPFSVIKDSNKSDQKYTDIMLSISAFKLVRGIMCDLGVGVVDRKERGGEGNLAVSNDPYWIYIL